jgi:hypothetical protein
MRLCCESAGAVNLTCGRRSRLSETVPKGGGVNGLRAGAIECFRTPYSQVFSQRRPQSRVSVDGASWHRRFEVSSNRRHTQVCIDSMGQRKCLMPTRRIPLRSV